MWFLYLQAAAVTLNAVVGMIPSGHDQKSTEALADMPKSTLRIIFILYAIFFAEFFSVSGEVVGIRWFGLTGYFMAGISVALSWYGYVHADDMFSKKEDDDGNHFGLSDLYLIASAVYSLIFIYLAAIGR